MQVLKDGKSIWNNLSDAFLIPETDIYFDETTFAIMPLFTDDIVIDILNVLKLRYPLNKL